MRSGKLIFLKRRDAETQRGEGRGEAGKGERGKEKQDLSISSCSLTHPPIHPSTSLLPTPYSPTSPFHLMLKQKHEFFDGGGVGFVEGFADVNAESLHEV